MDKVYKIRFRKSAEKQLLNIPAKKGFEIIGKIQMLAINPLPSDVKKMAGFQDVYRLRIGTYRIIYQIFREEIIIEIIKIGHRQNIYK